MPQSQLTRVTFRVKADLEIGQNVRLTGDHHALGKFSPNRGLDLVSLLVYNKYGSLSISLYIWYR